MLTLTKWCPVCGDAMKRVPSDGSSIMHRCDSCKTEVAKPAVHKRERRRVSLRVYRCGRAVGRTSIGRFFGITKTG